jgi:uncharacterized protein
VKPVFADTSFYAACLSPRDEHHALAIELALNSKATSVTKEFVLIELANLFSKLARREAAIKLINQVRGDANSVIVASTSELVERGFNLFSRRHDKEWSLTDCISFAVMQDYGVTHALTSDGHFEQAGFTKLM